MKKFTSILILLFSIFILTSCSQNKKIFLESAWIRPGIEGNTTAGYFVLVNPTNQSDKLVSVIGNASKRIEIHMTTMENDVMSMHEQEFVEIPEKSKVEFKPQGLHIMLMDLTADIIEGGQIELTFQFEKAGSITQTFDIKTSDE
jgi:copper(I)-binding protein